jgi:hypothetical protein
VAAALRSLLLREAAAFLCRVLQGLLRHQRWHREQALLLLNPLVDRVFQAQGQGRSQCVRLFEGRSNV